ncbi:NAD-binding lipoprotein [Streptomyces sp. NBC_00647]|uniref:CASTOR/POLLUX-related putative ion channel n=1 Tax=Streptomyces sp. NBC_00647 TaxID=2975796 RepID=UPI003245ADA1
MEREGRRPVSFRGRVRYRFDRTLARSTGTLMGWLVVSCLAVVVPVSALLVWTDPGSPRSLPGRLTAVWRTSARTLRLGDVTGTPLRMVLAAVLGLVALLCVSTLVGVITTGLEKRLTELSRGRSTVLEHGHAVVLGWSDQVFTVVAELVAAQAAPRPRAVVVLADRDKSEMERALAAHLGAAGRGRVVCRSGPASDPAVLALVSPGTARTVLVLPSGEATGDAEVLRVLLALRTVVGEEGAGPPVLAAVRDDRFRAPARLAAGPRGTVLESDTVTARLIAQCAGRPGLSLVLRDLLDFAGDEFHLADATAFQGRPFGAALLGHATSCVVGLLTAEGRTVLNPCPRTVIEPGSRLIVVSRDDTSAGALDCRHLVDPSARATAAPSTGDASRLLLLGWNRRAPLVIGQLRDTARPGSVLDVLTEGVVPGTDSAVLGTESPVPGTESPVPGTDSAVPGTESPVPGTDSAVPGTESPVPGTGRAVPAPAREPEPRAPDDGRLKVRHRSSALSRPESLLGLDLALYDAVLVLGPDPGAGPDHPDDWTLVTLLSLRLLEQRTGHSVRVVTELTDDRNRALAPLDPGSDVIVSGELTGLLMAQIAQSPHLAAVFDELFSAEGSGISLRPAGHYVRVGTTATFATVVAAARDRGECAIGYRRHDRWSSSPDHGVRLNPHKGERHEWSAEDQVVVVAAESIRGGGNVGHPHDGSDRSTSNSRTAQTT